MKLNNRPSYFYTVLLVAAFLAPLAGLAHAFTIDNQANTNSDGSAKFSDPDERFSGTGSSSGKTTVKQGNTTFQFGPAQQPFNRRFDSSNFFDPNRPTGER